MKHLLSAQPMHLSLSNFQKKLVRVCISAGKLEMAQSESAVPALGALSSSILDVCRLQCVGGGIFGLGENYGLVKIFFNNTFQCYCQILVVCLTMVSTTTKLTVLKQRRNCAHQHCSVLFFTVLHSTPTCLFLLTEKYLSYF